MSKPLYKGLYGLSPEKYVEYVLCDLKKASEKDRQFHKDYHTYLATQRNLLRDELLQSLKKVGINWLDIPSNSQWFGCYVKEAGIEAIIYPSLRYEGCYNCAVYPENFAAKSFIKLADDHSSVSEARVEINKKNYKFFEHPVEEFSMQ